MKTLIYNSANLSVKERLTISSLLSLFESRLNAKWVSVNHGQSQSPNVVFVDADRPEGRQALESSTSRETLLAVTSDDRWPHSPYVARPIHAYGPNGVVVLFNSIGQEPPVGTVRPPTPTLALRPAPPARPVPPPRPPIESLPRMNPPRTVADVPVLLRVTVRWGPPEPVILPPLIHMPGARIHVFGKAAPRREVLDLLLETPESNATPPVLDAPKPWHAPEPEARTLLVNMPIAHHPVELHRPPAPVIGRSRLEAQVNPKPAAEIDPATPFLRTSPPQWRAPEPETVPETEPAQLVSAVPEEAVRPDIEPARQEIGEALETLSDAIAVEALETELAEEDPGADWWGTAQFELEDAGAPSTPSAEGTLLSVLKAIKGSNQPSVLEIAGLPAVCVIPERNIYFTTAPAARLETAMGARAEVTWRPCSSEAEARQVSGTEQSRQASLEQLCWTASLLTAPADTDSLAGRAVRLRRWPPLTESRGRSKFVRYATLLSGAHATPRELADITGEPLEDIMSFVHACAEMNFLETEGQSKAPMAGPSLRPQGAGILRGMIEQLTPPKL